MPPSRCRAVLLGSGAALAIDYPAGQTIEGRLAGRPSKIAKQDKVVIAYMPPATEFNYYIAIGEGIKAAAAAKPGVETFMLAPQSGADINGQMGMIQDAITEERRARSSSPPMTRQPPPRSSSRPSSKGIAVIIVNSDIANFPTPVHGVVGYSQRTGTHKLGDYFLGKLNGAGQPRSASSKASRAITRRSGSAASWMR